MSRAEISFWWNAKPVWVRRRFVKARWRDAQALSFSMLTCEEQKRVLLAYAASEGEMYAAA